MFCVASQAATRSTHRCRAPDTHDARVWALVTYVLSHQRRRSPPTRDQEMLSSVGATYELPDGSLRRVVTSTARDAPPLGDWRAWPEAHAAADALAAALAGLGAPPLTGSCVDEADSMHDFAQHERTGREVMRRRVRTPRARKTLLHLLRRCPPSTALATLATRPPSCS
jgi:hypothetical protein